MPPKTRSGKAKIQSKQTKNHTEPQIMEEEHPPVPHKTKRKADRGAEELVKEVPEKKAPSKKIKQLSFAPTTTFPAPTQPFTTQSHNTTLSFKPQPDRNQLATNPFSDILFNMRSNLSLSKNPKDLEEEYRLLEELISTENRYHALKFKQIIIDLKSKDELKIMDAVTRLSTELSMAQEENFGQLQLDFLIPELIRCLQMENPEIMMHSAISITHILDIMPAASKILVNSGGVEVLCQKMQNFEYIDVAESSIKALEKVSGDFGLSILSAGGMEIMLTMIDFFVAQTQKLIMSIISNIFKLINSETMLKEKILPVLPLVLSYTQSDPSRQEIMYNMIHRLSDRVVRLCGEDFEKKREYIEIIAQDRMTANFCQVLNDLIESFDQAKLESIENILKTLNKFCYYSLPLCMEAFDGGIISIIDKLISILESPAGKENQFSNLAYETISLVNSILALRATPNPLIGKIAAYVGIKITENCNVQGRMEMFKNHPYIFQNLIEKVGLRLPGIFENNAGTLFKYIVLISFQKLIEFSDTEALSKQFDLQVIANFLSKLTTSNDIMIIAITFIIVDLLITKIPETYVILTREGVIDCIKALSSVTEANKLEAYSVVAKRYNPLDTLKQFTTSLNRMAAGGGGGSTDFFANLEAESHRLESIMQQLQFMKNPPESFSDSNDSKTLSSAEEGSPAEKSPAKTGMFSLQNIPKSASLEHKFITGLNKKPSKETGLMEEEAIPLEKPAAMNQPVDKMTEVRRDIAVFAQEIYNKVKVEMQKRNVSNLTPASITTKLEEISLSLEQNQWNPTEFGQKDFQKYLDLVSEHGRITNYELKNSKILSHLLNFIFDNVLLDEKENRKKVKSSPKEEEKKINSSDDLDSEKTKEKHQIELTDQQCRTILGRIISFLYHFKKIKNKATEEIHLQDFLKNLQEMLMNSDQFSLDSARNYQEYENNLNSDMRFLAQRVKFRAQYNPEVDSQSDKKKNLGMPNVLKQKSMRLEEEKKIFPSTLDNQAEMFSYKDSIFKEVPVLALSVEQFGTLEVIEDYLLNKLNSKDDLNGGLFGRHMHDFMSQRFGNPQETRDSEDDPSSQERESMEIEGTKKEGVNKVPVTNPKTKSPGSVNLQKSHSNIKTKNEGKFVRNDKKKWVDRLTGKEVNFKKYLECKFYLNGEELDKNITIYEIFTKYKGINNKYSGAFGDLGVEYKLALKKMETFEFSSGSRDQYKQPNMICLDHKSILQNLANRVSSLDLKSTETSSVKEIIQMIIFIHELVDLDRRILSPATVLNTLLIDLKNRYGLEDLITAYREDSVHLIRKELIPKNEFVNKKISLVTYKYLNDPITLAGGQVPDLLREICQKAPFILDFKSKYHYYKNGCFHISRALHYIYQTNKTRLKDLEGSRIGKLHRKKIKVSRDKILENAVVNFESYGSKKSVLDFEFQDEEGTGLGPTLEYYSMIASEVKNPEHHFWQQTANNLLFPSPIDPSDLKHPDPEKSKKRLHLQNKKRDFEKFQLVFRCIGTLLGRAILDERIVDVPLHSTFWDIILEKPLYIEDVSKIDPNLGDTLLGLQAVVNKKQEIENDQSLTPIERDERINNLQFKGCTIEDLTLTFTLPGYDEIELIENGPDTPVTIANLDQYVSLLTKFILMETLKSQVFAFREGFDKVIPLRHINIFESDEIEALVCGGTRDEAWDVKTLEDNFVPAHGYTQTSKSFKNFVKIVSEFTSEEKRIFLKFVTGAERLPFGGFKNLNPKLTVVKKQPNHHTEHPDQYLPSVMTCQNYVKLPDYSTFEVMKKKLFFSMNEGQNSFSLS